MIEMKVSGMMLDPLTNSPIVILKNDDGDRILPIWVGPFEAQAIAMKHENVSSPRPMTHDLMLSLLQTTAARVEKVVITDLRENTFYATIHVWVDEQHHAVDSRPSDGIALALRVEAPIYVEPLVLEKSQVSIDDESPAEPEKDLRKWFEDVDPATKYQM